MEIIDEVKWSYLQHFGVPKETIPILAASAGYYKEIGGIHFIKYWKSPNFDNRDEFFITLNAYLGMGGLLQELNNNSGLKNEFYLAYLFQLKMYSQNALSLDILIDNNCYGDAFVVCRRMISNLNLLILFALNPNLFNDWLNNTKDEKYLDSHICDELEHRGINTVKHLYKYSSEINHNQFLPMINIGYFNSGLFPTIKHLNNQLYVMAKYIIGMAYSVAVNMMLNDYDYKPNNHDLSLHKILYDWLIRTVLDNNRIDHFFTFIAEDRHWEKVGKKKIKVGSYFSYKEIEREIRKFHKKSGQRKKLSKKYDI